MLQGKLCPENVTLVSDHFTHTMVYRSHGPHQWMRTGETEVHYFKRDESLPTVTKLNGAGMPYLDIPTFYCVYCLKTRTKEA